MDLVQPHRNNPHPTVHQGKHNFDNMFSIQKMALNGLTQQHICIFMHFGCLLLQNMPNLVK